MHDPKCKALIFHLVYTFSYNVCVGGVMSAMSLQIEFPLVCSFVITIIVKESRDFYISKIDF